MDFFRRKKIYLKGLLSALLFLSGMVFIPSVSAATLFLRPSVSSIDVGGTFTLRALVNTQDVNINNIEAVINFPSDLVEASSVSSAGSILSLWVEQPIFSNASGVVSFNGGVPNPGYNGSSGSIVAITFKAKRPGAVSFYFSGAAVRANDGLGTDVLSGQGSASVTINGAAVAEPKAPTESITPDVFVPIIYSSIYPDQNAWYSVRSGTVSFKFPAGVSTVQTLISNNSAGTPSVSYAPPITSKTISNLTDGVWYFSLRYKLNGQWSGIARYKIQIDTIAPSDLSAEIISTLYGLTSIKLKASDLHLDHYEIIVDDNPPISASIAQAVQPVVLANLAGGTHKVRIVAYDSAGNKMEITKEFVSETVIATTTPVIVSPTPVAPVSPLATRTIFSNIVWPSISASWQIVLSIIGWLILIFFLLYGWYKFYVTRRKLLLAKSRADQAFIMLLDRADQQIKTLNKASKKRKLARSESVALVGLRETVAKIREIKANE